MEAALTHVDTVSGILHWLVGFDKLDNKVQKYVTISTTFRDALYDNSFWKSHALFLWSRRTGQNPAEFMYNDIQVNYRFMVDCLVKNDKGCWHVSVCDTKKLSDILNFKDSKTPEQNSSLKCVGGCETNTLWSCIGYDCNHVGCGRSMEGRHAICHYNKHNPDGESGAGHVISVSHQNRLWCYACNVYLTEPIYSQFKKAK